MATPEAKDVSLKVKLLVDAKEQRVLFAEAGKDFVDFLLNLISMPVGSITSLLLSNSTGMVGSLGKLYKSIEELSDTYLQPALNKDCLLNPKGPYTPGVVTPLLLPASVGSLTKKIYRCPRTCSNYVSDDPRAICPNCSNQMSREMSYVAPPAAPQGGSSSGGDEGGYVKGVVTYMVMDDLEVKPMSTISGITLLNTFNVKDIANLQEKMVSVGMDEGLKLLKASLQSKSVLTDVFLGIKAK